MVTFTDKNGVIVKVVATAVLGHSNEKRQHEHILMNLLAKVPPEEFMTPPHMTDLN